LEEASLKIQGVDILSHPKTKNLCGEGDLKRNIPSVQATQKPRAHGLSKSGYGVQGPKLENAVEPD